MANITEIKSSKNNSNGVVHFIKGSRLGVFYSKYIKKIPILRYIFMSIWKVTFPYVVKVITFIMSDGKWLMLKSISDYNKNNEIEKIELVESAQYKTTYSSLYPKEVADVLVRNDHDITAESISIYLLTDAIQYGATNLIVLGDTIVHHDLYDFVSDYTSEELHGRLIISSRKNKAKWVFLDKTPVELDVAASFVDATAGNYAHWITEVLPRIALFCGLQKYKNIPIIINSGLHKCMMESLLLISGDREIILLPTDKSVKAKKLYYVSATGYVPFDVRKGSFRHHGVFHPIAIKKLKELFESKLGCIKNYPEKIYIKRNSSTRNLLNSDAIEEMLQLYGFTTIEPEKLSFEEQFHIFHNARYIVSPTGAGLVNSIFCRPGTNITVLMSDHPNMIFHYWPSILSPHNLNVHCVIGDSDLGNLIGLHNDFLVDSHEFEIHLDKLSLKRIIPAKIHPTAQVSYRAKIGENVHIGPFCIIHHNVIIGDNVKIDSYCELGIPTPLGDSSPLCIGDNALIRSHSVFYESSTFDEGLTTGHNVIVRENTRAGIAFQIGSNTEIQGDCYIGNYVRFQSNIFVGKKTKIGNFVWVLPYVVFTNDPTPPSNQLMGCVIDDFASICAASTIMPGIHVGAHSLIAANSCVTKDVPSSKVVAGVPAMIIKETKDVLLKDGSGRPAYPWTRHFTRGYPESVTEKWNKEGY